MSVFPGPFTLDGAVAVAEAVSVAAAVARRAVPGLVDRSMLTPPRIGPDGRSRYAMLETLRAYGAGLLAESGEDHSPAPPAPRGRQRARPVPVGGFHGVREYW